LKPANVMLNKKDQPVILDFGLARRSQSEETRLTQSGSILGTPAYMSPEQVNGEVANMGPRTDVYALGVILYELLTGKVPFEGAFGTLMANILLTPPPPLETHVHGLDPRLQEVIDTALAKKPESRFASASEMAQALEAILKTPASRPAEPAVEELPEAEPVVAERAAPESRRRRPARSTRLEPARKTGSAPRRSSKGLLLSCGGCLLAVLVAASGLVYLAEKGFRGIWNQLSQEMDRARDFESAGRLWRPPPEDSGPDVLFPRQVGNYVLIGNDQNADQLSFGIRAKGRHATYRASEGTIELYVYRKSDAECYELATRVYDKVNIKEGQKDPAGGFRSLRGSPDSPPLVYSHIPPLQKSRNGIVWWKDGWFLHATADTPTPKPLEFLTQYLLTGVGPPASKPTTGTKN
jgi:hypothetical protein